MSKICIDFEDLEGVAQKLGLPRPSCKIDCFVGNNISELKWAWHA